MKTRVSTIIVILGILFFVNERGLGCGGCRNAAPAAVLTATPDSVVPDVNVTLDGSQSTDDGGITKYEWDFDYNGTFVCDYEETEANYPDGHFDGITTHTYTPGAHTVMLRVTDDGACDTYLDDTDLLVVPIGIIYVKPGANGNGTSWDNATSLQNALEVAEAGNEIWVAQGTYFPTAPNYCFEMVSDVGIYGGFAGNETSRRQRDWESNETIINGDTDNDGVPEVSYGVYADNVNTGAVLNGFIIKNTVYPVHIVNNSSPTIRNTSMTGGFKNNHDTGRGIRIDSSSPSIIDCNIQESSGYGINCVNYNGGRTVTITGCIIENCVVGGISSNGNAINISDCVIRNNGWGTEYFGFGIQCINVPSVTIKNNKIYHLRGLGIEILVSDILYFNPEVRIINNLICNNGDSNRPDRPASGVVFTSGSCCYSNSLVKGNTIVYNTGYGIDRWDDCWCGYTSCDSTLTIANCILSFNEQGTVPQYSLPFGSGPYYCYNITFSCGDDGNVPEGGGNIHDDPGFVDAENNNYHLSPDSPCIDAGDPSGNYRGEKDIDGEPRVIDGRADIGADEAVMPYGWWKFDEGSGTIAHDSAGDNDGTIYGATWTSGKINSALSFDGVNDYIDVGDEDDLDFGATDSFTIEAWIKSGTDNQAQIVSKRRFDGGGYGREGYCFKIHQNKLYFAIEDTYGHDPEIYSDTVVTDNEWHRVTAVRDVSSDKLYLYLDGQLDATPVTDTTTSSLATSQSFWIGRLCDYDLYFNGKIDDVRIYNCALHTTDLFGWWKLDEGSGTTAYDFMGNHNGNVTGASWTTGGKIGGALSFDGSGDYVYIPNFVPGNQGTFMAWAKSNVDINDLTPQRYNNLLYSNRCQIFLGSPVTGHQGEVRFIMSPEPGCYSTLHSNKDSWDAGEWYHITCTWNGTTQAVYVNGSLDKSQLQTYSGGWGTTYIGGTQGDFSISFNGVIDNVRIFDKALSGEEVEQIYTDGCE